MAGRMGGPGATNSTRNHGSSNHGGQKKYGGFGSDSVQRNNGFGGSQGGNNSSKNSHDDNFNPDAAAFNPDAKIAVRVFYNRDPFSSGNTDIHCV